MVGEVFSTCRNQERLHGGGENDNYYSKLWSVTWRSGQVKGERREETGAQLTEVTPCVLSCWPFCFRGFLMALCVCSRSVMSNFLQPTGL